MRISDWSSDVCSSDLLLDDSSVQQYFRRSDHFALVKRGVPMVMLTGIFSREREKDDAIDRYFERDYHQAGDELEAVPSFDGAAEDVRSEEHTSELQSLMRISYAVFCLKKKKAKTQQIVTIETTKSCQT